jgi:serine/threonine protein kinase
MAGGHFLCVPLPRFLRRGGAKQARGKDGGAGDSPAPPGKGGAAGGAGASAGASGSPAPSSLLAPRLASSGDSSSEMDKPRSKNRIGEYVCVKLIGKGSFGKVFLARAPDGRPVAVKALQLSGLRTKRKQRLVLDEKMVMVECGEHPFVLRLLHAFSTPTHVCLVSEFCGGGELFFHLDKAGRFDEPTVRFLCAEMTLALSHLHEHGIAYRDLKSENVLLDKLGHLRLADFGLAAPRVTENQGARSICGTPAYIAPEMIRCGGRQGTGYGFSVDYWSMGSLMYDFLCGRAPFAHADMEQMCKNILGARLEFPNGVELSPEARDVITQLLKRDPEERLGSSKLGGLASIQAHTFFSTTRWDSLLQRSNVPAPMQLRSMSVRRSFNGSGIMSVPSLSLASVGTIEGLLEDEEDIDGSEAGSEHGDHHEHMAPPRDAKSEAYDGDTPCGGSEACVDEASHPHEADHAEGADACATCGSSHACSSCAASEAGADSASAAGAATPHSACSTADNTEDEHDMDDDARFDTDNFHDDFTTEKVEDNLSDPSPGAPPAPPQQQQQQQRQRNKKSVPKKQGSIFFKPTKAKTKQEATPPPPPVVAVPQDDAPDPNAFAKWDYLMPGYTARPAAASEDQQA